MDILKYKDYEGTAELDMDRKVCRGKILFINDLVTYESASPADLQKEFEAAVDDYLDTCAAIGKEPLRPCKGMFQVRVDPAVHRAAVLRATVEGVSLNEIVGRALDGFLNARSDVNHTIKVTFEGLPGTVQTIASVASGKTTWGTANVH